MNSDDKESAELERRMQIALQKAGYIIPSDLDPQEEPPAEAMLAPIPESLSNTETAMARILGNENEDTDGNNVLDFPPNCGSSPFAIAARNGEVKLSEESLKKLKRGED